jgi:hypothetical protein
MNASMRKRCSVLNMNQKKMNSKDAWGMLSLLLVPAGG